MLRCSACDYILAIVYARAQIAPHMWMYIYECHRCGHRHYISKEEIDMTTTTTDAITHWDAKRLPALSAASVSIIERHYSDGLNIHVRALPGGTLTASMWDDSSEIGADYVTTDDPRDAYVILRDLAGDDADALHSIHASLLDEQRRRDAAEC